jgi:hypothetical protein
VWHSSAWCAYISLQVIYKSIDTLLFGSLVWSYPSRLCDDPACQWSKVIPTAGLVKSGEGFNLLHYFGDIGNLVCDLNQFCQDQH